jgi:hypothetical protein
MAGDHAIALWTMKGEEGHPATGPGLVCKLLLPHTLRGRSQKIIRRLNQLEIWPLVLPPHFGS